MKNVLCRCILVFCFLAVWSNSFAQNPVENALKMRYSRVQYNRECGGWYFLSYQNGSQTLYGFADARGNVVVSDALKYEKFPGFIKFYLLDSNQKMKHDQWVEDMRQYERDYQNYQRIKASYESEVEAYNAKVNAAKQEAQNIWQQERQRVYNRVQQQNQARMQQQQQNTSFLGALLSGVASGLEASTAMDAVKFEPIYNQVLANRGLTVGPSEPYNPRPTKPSEPSSGYYWASFPLRQPSNYTEIDYAQITDGTGFADVAINGKWGLVDAYFNEIIPCTNSSKVHCGKIGKNYKVCVDGRYGIIAPNGKFVIPADYGSIEPEGDNLIVQFGGKKGMLSATGKEIMPCRFEQIVKSNGYLLCSISRKWGCYTSDFQELYPCQFQNLRFEKINGKLFMLSQDKGLWGVIDFQTGKSILPNNYSEVKKYSLADLGEAFSVVKEGKQGLYMANGILLLPSEYNSIVVETLNSASVLAVKKGTALGYYELNGNPIISEDAGYEKVTSLGILFKVEKNGKVGLCSKYGEELVPCEYSSLKYEGELQGFMAQKDGMYGLISVLGQEMFPFVVEDISYSKYNPNYFTMGRYKKYGVIDFDGNRIVEPKCKDQKAITKNVAKYCKKQKVDISVSSERVKAQLAAALNNYRESVRQVEAEHSKFSYYAQNYVERIINDWQKRGEFEKLDVWRMRVNNETRNQKVYSLTKEAQDQFIKMHERKLKGDNIYIQGDYDPEHEVYRIKSEYAGKDILVPVAIDDASEFKTNFASLKMKPTFFIENDQVAVAEYAFTMANGRTYKYSNRASLTYSIAQVEYNFDDITIDASSSGAGGGKQSFSTTSITLGTSDVDVMVPKTDVVQENTFAIIIANENYEREKNVEFAYNDGMTFKDYCVKSFGIPAENVHFHPNATLNDMRFAFNWIRDVANTSDGKAKFVIYYAGHGVPDDARDDACLLPVDGFSSDLSTGYRLSTLYNALGELPAENVTVFLDACFSGGQRSGEVMASTRGVAITTHLESPKGNVVVFSAASNAETAHPYKEKSHGLFTYFLLKKVQSENGNVKLGNLTDYVTSEVKKISVRQLKKAQTPVVTPSENVAATWRETSL